MDEDEYIRDQVYDLRKAKDLIKLCFGDATPPEKTAANYTDGLRRQCITRIAAASAAIVIGLSASYAGYKACTHTGFVPAQSLAELSQQKSERIIIHVSESDPAQFKTTLAYTERFLKEHKKNGRAQIEVVAYAGGIDLLRNDLPLHEKVKSMMDEYDNLTFIACTNAINRLRAQGFNPAMIKNVDTEKAALTHIIDRLQDGWTYIKADSETLKI
jgi:intracellular sulfur oxidation DsrE/DsrF family protein